MTGRVTGDFPGGPVELQYRFILEGDTTHATRTGGSRQLQGRDDLSSHERGELVALATLGPVKTIEEARPVDLVDAEQTVH